MNSQSPLSGASAGPGYAWLARALGPRDGVLGLSAELWPAVEPLLATHRAAGLLYDRIQVGSVEAPRLARYELSARVARWAEATRDWPAAAGRLLHEFDRHGLPHLVLKGWALIPLVYDGRRELREVSDLDVFIPRSRLAEADALLRSEGFAIPPQAELRPGFAHAYGHEADYVRACATGRPMTVDLHWRLLKDPQFWPRFGGDWFDRIRAVPCAGRRWPVPSSEDMFLHLCAHGALSNAGDGLTRLYRLLDLVRLGTVPGFAWPILLDRARQASLTGALRSGVEAVAALWPGAIPAEWAAACGRLPSTPEEDRSRRQRAASAKAVRFDPDVRRISGWGGRIRYMGGKLFPSGAHLRSVHHLPPGAWYARGLLARWGTRLKSLACGRGRA